MGVNYVDTSSVYLNGNSERCIGEILRGRRNKFHIPTKFHFSRGRQDTRVALIREAEGSLQRLKTDYLDILLVHNVSSLRVVEHEEVQAAFDTLKKEGKVRTEKDTLSPMSCAACSITGTTGNATSPGKRIGPYPRPGMPGIAPGVECVNKPAPAAYGSFMPCARGIECSRSGLTMRKGDHRAVMRKRLWGCIPGARAFLDGSSADTIGRNRRSGSAVSRRCRGILTRDRKIGASRR